MSKMEEITKRRRTLLVLLEIFDDNRKKRKIDQIDQIDQFNEFNKIGKIGKNSKSKISQNDQNDQSDTETKSEDYVEKSRKLVQLQRMLYDANLYHKHRSRSSRLSKRCQVLYKLLRKEYKSVDFKESEHIDIADLCELANAMYVTQELETLKLKFMKFLSNLSKGDEILKMKNLQKLQNIQSLSLDEVKELSKISDYFTYNIVLTDHDNFFRNPSLTYYSRKEDVENLLEETLKYHRFMSSKMKEIENLTIIMPFCEFKHKLLSDTYTTIMDAQDRLYTSALAHLFIFYRFHGEISILYNQNAQFKGNNIVFVLDEVKVKNNKLLEHSKNEKSCEVTGCMRNARTQFKNLCERHGGGLMCQFVGCSNVVQSSRMEYKSRRDRTDRFSVDDIAKYCLFCRPHYETFHLKYMEAINKKYNNIIIKSSLNVIREDGTTIIIDDN